MKRFVLFLLCTFSVASASGDDWTDYWNRQFELQNEMLRLSIKAGGATTSPWNSFPNQPPSQRWGTSLANTTVRMSSGIATANNGTGTVVSLSQTGVATANTGASVLPPFRIAPFPVFDPTFDLEEIYEYDELMLLYLDTMLGVE